MESAFELDAGGKNFPLLEKATKTGAVYRVQVPEAERYASLSALEAAGARIVSVSQIKATLEDFFMNLVEADRAQASAVGVSGKWGTCGWWRRTRFGKRCATGCCTTWCSSHC